MAQKNQTLGDQLSQDIARVKQLIQDHNEGKASGLLHMPAVEKALRRAEVAQASGDAVAMFNACQELQGCQ